MRNPTTPTHAHGVTHTRPIVARGVHFNAANDTDEILERALQERRQAVAADRAARERVAADFARCMQERRALAASRQQDEDRPVYRTTCSLCGDPSDRQVCARCNVGLTEVGL